MFIGHYGVAAAGRAKLAGPSLGAWFMAVQWLDLVWPVLVLLGIERMRVDPGNTEVTPLEFVYYPWSHSLLMAVVWSIVFGAVYWALRRDPRGAAALGCGVFSHWVLDWLTHRPDLPLWPGGEFKVGLGLWNSVAGTLVVEVAIFAGAVIWYTRVTRGTDRVGRYGWWALVCVLGAIYLGNLVGPPPPNETAVAVSALGLWLFVAWAYWVDRHRVTHG